MKRPKRKRMIKHCTFCGKRIKSFFPSTDNMIGGLNGEIYFFCSKEHKNTWEKQEVAKMVATFSDKEVSEDE